MKAHSTLCNMVHCQSAMLHRNIMHHIGALPICHVAPQHIAPPCLNCLTAMLHCTIVAPHHHAPHWCIPHYEIASHNAE
jgi:hypothetical protein